ncbi:MAG: hypothetical protein Q9182_001525 [Xanthomendoza sp. 2 TL-2023]
MSGEVALATQEATVTSNPESKHLPNSHPPPATAETVGTSIDSSTSAVGPKQSTLLNSASTTAQTSPAQATTSNRPHSEQQLAESTSEHPGRIRGAELVADWAVQSASPTLPPVKQASEPNPAEQAKSSKRGSRGSIKAPSRRGSGTSNKLAKDRIALPATSSQEKSGGEVVDNSAKPKKKGLSRFFSILNCCGGAQKDASELELDQAVPSKKAKTSQTNRGRQTTPMTDPNNTSTGESKNTESKEAIEDSIAGKRYSELTPSTQPKFIEPPVKETPMTEKPPLHDNVVPLAEPKIAPVPTLASEQPLPPLPSDTTDERNSAMTNTKDYDEKPVSTGTDGLVEAPIPPTTDSMAEQGVSREESTINDRPPQQEARDVEMSDAPPVAPTPEPPAPSPDTSIQSPPQANLPPPPPIINSRRPSAGNRRASNGVASEQPKGLLPPIADRFRGKKCLVLDLDETLVHSSFKILHQADFTIPVEIEGQYHNVYVIKRPGVDQFMKRVGELYEVVVFTASVSKYGDPLLDQLDIHNVVHHRLFRESCYNHQGNYVKDLSQVGRDLRETIIIDNSPTSYIFHPQHAVPISSWFSDAHDNELLDLIPVLEDLAGPQVRDVSLVLDVGL